MFLRKQFGPASITGTLIPRIFTYLNIDDTLAEMKEPGYFNKVKMILTKHSRIEVVAMDYNATIFVHGVVDTNLCMYADDIRAIRGEVVLPKTGKQPVKKKKAKAA